MSFTGGCLCGAVRYQIERRFLNTIHCYCDMCRKAHGTAFSSHTVMRPDQLTWQAGKSILQPYESSQNAYRAFCTQCGTQILVHGQSGDDTLAIPAGTLDGDPELTITGHMFVQECVGWYQINDELPQHKGWPPGIGRS